MCANCEVNVPVRGISVRTEANVFSFTLYFIHICVLFEKASIVLLHAVYEVIKVSDLGLIRSHASDLPVVLMVLLPPFIRALF